MNMNKPKQASLFDIKAYSYSDIDLFLQCPLRYKYGVIDGLPHKYQNTYYIRIGANIHNTLKEFYEINDCKNRNFDNLIEILKPKWNKSVFKSLDESEYWFEIVESSLRNYLNIDSSYMSDITLCNEKKFHFELKGSYLTGKIDRIDKISGDDVEVIDYKTGNFLGSTEEHIKDDLQWIFYYLGSKKFFKLNPTKITFYYIFANKKISFSPNDTEINIATEKLLRIINQIKNTKDFKATPNKFCSNCLFIDKCKEK